MMLARRLFCQKQLWQVSCKYRTVVRHTQSTANQIPETFSVGSLNLEPKRLPEALKKQPQRQPFAKNLFLGALDHEFMYYPEPQTKDRYNEFFEWLKPIENCISECLANPEDIERNEILSELKNLGLFRAYVSEDYNGLNLNHTELAKLLEVLSSLPWLGSYFVKNYIMPIQLINMLGSDAQKAKYLPRIVSGEVVPTVCFTEANGFNPQNIETRAVSLDDNMHWLLSGEKTFVTNGQDANLFIIFAQCGLGRASTAVDNVLSVFLVESNVRITVRDVSILVGQQGTSISTITFNDIKVPKENLLGKIGSGMDVLIDLIAPGNRQIAPQTIGILKNFIKLLVKNILQRKHLDRDLHEYELIQQAIGKIATRLYGMESILYMTTGMMDTFDKQDCALEKAMVEVYCANECIACIHEGLHVIGAQSYIRGNPYMQILEDALSYTLYDSYNIDSNVYVSLLGLQHTGKNMYKHIHKLRNPFMYPKYIVKWMFGYTPVRKVGGAEHMHPSLAPTDPILDTCISKLADVAILLLERHGQDISDQQMELGRLSDLATRTFALISVLSRTSRAYCIGLRNAEQERHVANSFAIFCLGRVTMLTDEILKGSWSNGDRLFQDIANLIYSKKDYFAEHPLKRTY
ncbi:acyl-CoA dehydrogenase family member 9, mitochondrial [Harpegnathos saltator]|uniref:Acyl-CoA dehydrogenase family member 9, mitochondrial n=1 Tax=Harpegnathos saltator TaxID=610380 RepID=E2C643_HARSA|nr:acyl-CoA dehydrogenase family member 9, mitochondrial [Harpegnathos saltator]EFN76586.1 Acyl-CoA dehydrogenase family member 9, mitochondrial [Harpegnathos saltator]